MEKKLAATEINIVNGVAAQLINEREGETATPIKRLLVFRLWCGWFRLTSIELFDASLLFMNRLTIRLLAEKYMWLATPEKFIDWAVSSLEAGLDTKSIRILASLQKPFFSIEVEDYFYRSLKELGWKLPESKECVIEYARFLAEEILSGGVLPVEGCRRMYNIAVFLEYPPQLSNWFYSDEGLMPDSYKELTSAELDAAIIKEAQKIVGEAVRYDS